MKFDITRLDYEKDKDYRELIRVDGHTFRDLFVNKSTKEWSTLLGVSKKQIRLWKSGKIRIPLRVLLKLGKKNRIVGNVKKLYLYSGKSVIIPEGLNELLCEFVGRHCGDGSITIKNNDYRIVLTESPEFLKMHAKDIENLFGIKPKIRIISKKYGRVIFSSKIIVRFLEQFFDIKHGPKTHTITEPKIIRNSKINHRIAFVKGLINTEGSVYKSNRAYYFEIKLVNKNLLNSVKEIFDLLRIKYYYMIKGNYYTIRVLGLKEIDKINRLIGFNNPRIKIPPMRPGKQVPLAEKAKPCRENHGQ